MTKCRLIFRVCVCALCMAAALVFIGIEGWLLFSGDWMLFENSALFMVQLCLRIVIALAAFFVSLFAAAGRNRSFIWLGIGFLAASAAVTPMLSNGLGWGFVLLSALFIASEKCVWQRVFRGRRHAC